MKRASQELLISWLVRFSFSDIPYIGESGFMYLFIYLFTSLFIYFNIRRWENIKKYVSMNSKSEQYVHKVTI